MVVLINDDLTAYCVSRVMWRQIDRVWFYLDFAIHDSLKLLQPLEFVPGFYYLTQESAMLVTVP